VDFYVDRGVTHELVRHRLFSFTQESTRFVNYRKKMPPSFVQPGLDCADSDVWEEAIGHCEAAYQALIESGVTPQIARSVFPNALASRIVVTGNLRNWRHFLLMRTTKEAHPQMREVTIPLLAEFKERIPVLFEDIEPLARQVDNIGKGR
jgi:thymidylate synthase (FAD)